MQSVHELTDYVVPVAEKVKTDFETSGGAVNEILAFNPGETDFSSIILKASKSNPDGLFIGVQAPDTAILIMKQVRALNLKVIVFGNEQFAGALHSAGAEERTVLDEVIFAQPKCDLSSSSVKAFADQYTARYQVDALPFGCYTAEAYDSVQLLSTGLRKCGQDVECVKQYLYSVKNYPGASGTISFDDNGDVSKDYVIQKIEKGKIVDLGKN